MDLNGVKKIYISLSLFKSSSYTCMIFCLYSVIFRVVMGPQVILLRTRVFIHNNIQTAIYIQMNVQSGSIPIFFVPSIWVLVAAQTDICMKYAIFCVASRPDLCHLCNVWNHTLIHLPLSDFWYDKNPSKRYEKGAKNRRFLHFFHSTSVKIHHIANLRAGGKSAYGFASFSCTSFCYLISGRILNAEWHCGQQMKIRKPVYISFSMDSYPTIGGRALAWAWRIKFGLGICKCLCPNLI